MAHHEEHYSNYGSLTVDEYVKRHLLSSPVQRERIANTVAAVPGEVSSLLDVGAGHGLFLDELKRVKGISGVGLEITDEKVDYCRQRGLDMRRGDASRLDFEDRSFDAVVAFEVLEHLPWGTYEAALGEFARVARGWIMMSVPYRERRTLAACPYCGARSNPNFHFRSFDEGVLRDLFPGFALDKTLLLGVETKPVVTMLRSVLPARWSKLMVCPSCNYRETKFEAADESQPSEPAAGNGRMLKRLAVRLSPKITRARWLLGVFRRQT